MNAASQPASRCAKNQTDSGFGPAARSGMTKQFAEDQR
ncbi:MAG: hypothetical protein OJF55_001386 [Rhodanobacteraceae bacterium]|nr:MAG: hypothetical protein OJF55_001386 [Rhodanobacteraceae bacterium]